MSKYRLTLKDLGMIVEDTGFSMPDPAESILTSVPPGGEGTDEALSLIDGGDGSPGINWKPEMQGQPTDAPEDREAEEMGKTQGGIESKKGSQSGGSQSGGQSGEQKGEQSGGQQSDNKPDFLKKTESFKLSLADLGLVVEDEGNPFAKKEDGEQGEQQAPAGGQQAPAGGQQPGAQASGGQQGAQPGGQQAPAQGQQGGQQDAGGPKGVQDSAGQQSGPASGVCIDQELLSDILRAAATDQPDESQIGTIVQAIMDCAAEGKTLGVADAGTIMDNLKSAVGQQGGQGQQAPAGGQQPAGQQSPMGGQQAPAGGQQPGMGAQPGPEQTDSFPPGDGQVAGPEGGQQHQGKTKLMAGLGESKKPSKKLTLAEAWIMAVPGVGVSACLGEASGIEGEEIDEDTLRLRKMARASGNPNWFNVGR